MENYCCEICNYKTCKKYILGIAYEETCVIRKNLRKKRWKNVCETRLFTRRNCARMVEVIP